MPKDFTTDIISMFKRINASKYKSRSSQEGREKKKKKRKYQLKYIYVENDERDNYYQQNCAKRKC